MGFKLEFSVPTCTFLYIHICFFLPLSLILWISIVTPSLFIIHFYTQHLSFSIQLPCALSCSLTFLLHFLDTPRLTGVIKFNFLKVPWRFSRHEKWWIDFWSLLFFLSLYTRQNSSFNTSLVYRRGMMNSLRTLVYSDSREIATESKDRLIDYFRYFILFFSSFYLSSIGNSILIGPSFPFIQGKTVKEIFKANLSVAVNFYITLECSLNDSF